jgi:hypothetical protein
MKISSKYFFRLLFLSPSTSNKEQRRCTDSFARFQQESWEQSLTDCYLDGQHDSRFATGCVSPEPIEQWTRNALNCSNYSSIFSLFSWVLLSLFAFFPVCSYFVGFRISITLLLTHLSSLLWLIESLVLWSSHTYKDLVFLDECFLNVDLFVLCDFRI